LGINAVSNRVIFLRFPQHQDYYFVISLSHNPNASDVHSYTSLNISDEKSRNATRFHVWLISVRPIGGFGALELASFIDIKPAEVYVGLDLFNEFSDEMTMKVFNIQSSNLMTISQNNYLKTDGR